MKTKKEIINEWLEKDPQGVSWTTSDRIEFAMDEYASQKKEWIDAKLQQPEQVPGLIYSNHVLCQGNGTKFIGFYFHKEGYWTNAHDSNDEAFVDKWMPLP